MRIDAHQHFWRLADRAGQWPPPELTAISRDFGPSDLEPLLHECGVTATVLVQSLPSVADTRFLLDLADRHPFIAAVVGWVDLKAPDAAAQIADLAGHRRLKGLRPMLQDLPDDRWIDDPALDAAVDAMLRHDLVFDALVLPRHLGALARFARRHPTLPIVIDHAAKPPIATGDLARWATDIASLAQLGQVSCKLSGLLTEAGDRRRADDLEPVVAHVLQQFGARRVIWGSDWPVLRLAGDYAGWLRLSESLCTRALAATIASPADLADALADIFGANAQRFYRLASTPARS
jgi:L-fuconolactonase